jgi:hypothetical protein
MLADLDYWLRLTLNGYLRLTGEVVINYRIHAGAQSHRSRKVWSRLPSVYRKLLRSRHVTEEQRELLRLGYRWRHHENARLWWRVARESVLQRDLFRSANAVRHALLEEAAHHYVRL